MLRSRTGSRRSHQPRTFQPQLRLPQRIFWTSSEMCSCITTRQCPRAVRLPLETSHPSFGTISRPPRACDQCSEIWRSPHVEGDVQIAWTVGEDRAFALEWVEEGAPQVSPPIRQGFGSLLIGKMVELYFNGHVEHEFAAVSVRFRLTGRQFQRLLRSINGT